MNQVARNPINDQNNMDNGSKALNNVEKHTSRKKNSKLENSVKKASKTKDEQSNNSQKLKTEKQPKQTNSTSMEKRTEERKISKDFDPNICPNLYGGPDGYKAHQGHSPIPPVQSIFYGLPHNHDKNQQQSVQQFQKISEARKYITGQILVSNEDEQSSCSTCNSLYSAAVLTLCILFVLFFYNNSPSSTEQIKMPQTTEIMNPVNTRHDYNSTYKSSAFDSSQDTQSNSGTLIGIEKKLFFNALNTSSTQPDIRNFS